MNQDTKLARDTLYKIQGMLNQNSQKPIQPVQYIKLEQLFDRLSSKLSPAQQEQYRFKSLYYREVSTRAKRSKQSQSLPVVSTPVVVTNPSQQLATQLGWLDYTQGQATFEESIKRLKPAGAFFIDVCDTKVQRWLVKRLAQQIMGFQNGKKLEINVACLGGNFEVLWAEFARQLQLPDETADATIAKLIELCQGKTVIIALSRFQQLDEAMQQRLMTEFWWPLVQQIQAQQRNWRSRLVLFLLRDGARLERPANCPFEVWPGGVTPVKLPIVHLESLVELASHDVQGWFEESFDLLAAHIGEVAAEEFMQQERMASWDSHPWTTLENICNVFRTEIAEIEPYWKLVG